MYILLASWKRWAASSFSPALMAISAALQKASPLSFQRLSVLNPIAAPWKRSPASSNLELLLLPKLKNPPLLLAFFSACASSDCADMIVCYLI